MNKQFEVVFDCEKCKKEFTRSEHPNTAPDCNLSLKEQQRFWWCDECKTDTTMKEFALSEKREANITKKKRKKENMETIRKDKLEVLKQSDLLAKMEEEREKLNIQLTPKVEAIVKKSNNISPVEERLISTNVKVDWIDDEPSFNDVNGNNKKIAMLRESNVYNFYKQINHNLIIGAKSLFLVCRDLKVAQHTLNSDDFKVLSEALPMSDSTISKYISIAESKLCKELYVKNKLPESWTTMYAIAQVEDKDGGNNTMKDKILKNVSVNTTMSDFNKLINKVVKSVVNIFNFKNLNTPKSFLKIAIENDKEKGSIDPNALLIIKNKVEKAVEDAMSDYEAQSTNYSLKEDVNVEVITDDVLISKSKESVMRYFKGLKNELFKGHFLDTYNSLTGSELSVSSKK
tara:strand:+ start:4750 stop:5955 length:1206 start_codon:yes stop_codon:yes gene_type:complete